MLRYTDRLLIMALLSVLAAISAAAQVAGELKSFPASPGDTLIIQNDYGLIRIGTWEQNRLEAHIRTGGTDSADGITVIAQKSSDKIFIYAFYAVAGEGSAEFEIQTPAGVNVVVWGANPVVEVRGIAGSVRVHTLTSRISAVNLLSSASLLSEQGPVTYSSSVQPESDIHLESGSGNIRCTLERYLNFTVLARAGGNISWDGKVEATRGTLERKLGAGSSLLHANSTQGSVLIEFSDTPGPAPPTAADLPRTEPAPAVAAADPAAGEIPRTRPVAEVRTTAPADTREPQPRVAEPAGAAPGPRATAGEPAAGGTVSFKVNVDWVFLNASVRDRQTNRSVPYLAREDFLVYEDGVLQNVEQFQQSDAPYHLLLLLDVSGSTRNYMDLIKEASIDFTGQIKANDEIAVAAFNSNVRLLQGFTNDRRRVANAIERIRSGGGTAFYDALETSVGQYLRDVEGRKAVVVFSDGVDNQLTGDLGNGSQSTFDDVYRMVQESDSIIYTIFLDTEETASRTSIPTGRRGSIGGILGDILRGSIPGVAIGRSGDAYEMARRQLELIADQTGGRMYTPRRIQDLSHVYGEIADDLRIQYTLGYSSSNTAQDGKWRAVEVRLRDNGNGVVRTRKGYYARRETNASRLRP